MTTMNMGMEGTIFFVGKVEDIQDPQKLGRVRVRFYYFHSANTALLPTEDLPWAPILMPGTSASLSAIGRSPTGMLVGSTVIGFFMDGMEAQIPVVLGSLHGIPDQHDVSLLARGTNDIDKQRVGPEPASAYAAQYPYNHTWTTEGGHKIEVDDTPNAERLHIWHKSGSYVEINAEGRVVAKAVGDAVEVVLKDKWVHVEGNGDVRVRGNLAVHVEGNASIDVDGKVDMSVGGNASVLVQGDASLDVTGRTNIHSSGALTIAGDSSVTITAERELTLSGNPLNLN